MLIIGYIAAAIIGVVLGMVGAGGSILAVPILIYLFNIPVHTATMYSLFVVGVSSFFGTLGYIKNKQYSFKTILYFGIPSVFSIYFTRTLVVHKLPEVLFSIGTFSLTRDAGIMILFSSLMIAASYSMIKKPPVDERDVTFDEKAFQHFKILLLGLLVGFIAGLLGAGGGFMMIPALVILAGLPMRVAVGTSLTIICVNSIIGFLGDLLYCTFPLDWKFMITFTALSVGGIFIGTRFSKFVPANKLRVAFGWLILVMGILILAENFIKPH